MQKITMKDYVRLGIKDTNTLCVVNEGDLVKITHKSGLGRTLKKQTIGIVTETIADKMCIITGDAGRQWWSRYVNCEVLSYNNKELN